LENRRPFLHFALHRCQRLFNPPHKFRLFCGVSAKVSQILSGESDQSREQSLPQVHGANSRGRRQTPEIPLRNDPSLQRVPNLVGNLHDCDISLPSRLCDTLELCFLIHTPVFLIYWKVILDAMCYGDIFVNFFTGYVDSERQKIELRGFKVALHYLLGFFIIDLVSSSPISLYIYLTDTSYMYPLKGILFVKLFRLPTLHSYITKYLQRRKVWSSSLKSLALSMYFIVGVFWFLGTTMYMQTVIMNKEEFTQETNVQDKLEKLINMCTEIIECVMLVGPDAGTFHTDWPIKIMNIFYIVAGSAINMIILAQVLRIYKSRNSARNKHQKLLQEISQYMTYRQIPPDLKEKIIHYVEFKYQKRILKEAEIMSTLSESLREVINCFNPLQTDFSLSGDYASQLSSHGGKSRILPRHASSDPDESGESVASGGLSEERSHLPVWI
jgi:hypothetical protein